MIASKPILKERQRGAYLLIEYPMPLFKKPLKISLKEPKLCDQSPKNILKKRTQLDILSQPKKRVRINNIIANIGNLEVNCLEVVQSMTTALQIRLDEFYNIQNETSQVT